MEEEQNKKVVKVPGWFAISTLCIFFIVILIILYLTFIRYSLVSKSIDKSDVTTSALLLSPEIAAGLARFI